MAQTKTKAKVKAKADPFGRALTQVQRLLSQRPLEGARTPTQQYLGVALSQL